MAKEETNADANVMISTVLYVLDIKTNLILTIYDKNIMAYCRNCVFLINTTGKYKYGVYQQ